MEPIGHRVDPVGDVVGTSVVWCELPGFSVRANVV